MSDEKHPYGTPPRRGGCDGVPVSYCDQRHAKYGWCARKAGHLGPHRWIQQPFSWWWIVALAIAAALWIFSAVARGQTQISPRQIKGLANATVLQCAGVTGTTAAVDATPTSPAIPTVTSTCDGLYYIDLVYPNGAELKVIGVPIAPGTPPLNMSQWKPYP